MNETNAERLAEIEIRQLYMERDGLDYSSIRVDDFNWVFRQAERAQEFENLYDEQLEESQTTYKYFNSEIKRFREVLEWYADRFNYVQSMNDRETGYPPEIMNDTGYQARKALEVESCD